MDDCDTLIEQLHDELESQLSLAMFVDATAIRAMHIDLAALAREQLRYVFDLCP